MNVERGGHLGLPFRDHRRRNTVVATGTDQARLLHLAPGAQADVETLPRYENTVSLSPKRRDRWGLPLLQVDMAYSDNERAMLKDVKETATEMLKAARCESVQGFEREPVPGEVIHWEGTPRRLS